MSIPKITKNLMRMPTNSALQDLFGRQHNYLRISLTERCNLRCQYCMPTDGVHLTEARQLLTTDEILRVSRVFAKLGVVKVRLTGGEPTVRRDLTEIIQNLKAVDGLQQVAMTTNGLTLTRQLVAYQRAGLDAINISLDTLQSARYDAMTRRRGLHARVLRGLDLALQLGYSPVKVNCVVMKGFNEDEIVDFVRLTKATADLQVRFIEYMPFDGNGWDEQKMVSYVDMLAVIRAEFGGIEVVVGGSDVTAGRVSCGVGETAKVWRVPNHAGTVGFITSMSEHFCGTCNRLRVTADGNLKVCLFGNAEVSLRDALRGGCTDDDLTALIGGAVRRKKRQHAGMLDLASSPNRPMILIGGPMPRRASPPLIPYRNYSSSAGSSALPPTLSHINQSDGRAQMVDTTGKPSTSRRAVATATVHLTAAVLQLLPSADGPLVMRKGDVLAVAQLAGISAAKLTAQLIPLCHNISLDDVQVVATVAPATNCVHIRAEVKCHGRTGAEMEALCAATVAALTVYDMCKAVTHDIVIGEVRLLEKSGGVKPAYNPQSVDNNNNKN